MEGDKQLLKEMKTLRNSGNGSQADLPDTVAGANGEVEVVEKFKEVYSALYNSADTEAEMADLMNKVSDIISPNSSEEVSRITGHEVKAAVSQLQPKKSDVSGGFTSDDLIHASDELFDIIS